MLGYVRLLRHSPNFSRLWTAQAISLLGDWFSAIALSALVVAYSHGSGLAVGLLQLTRFMPPLLVGPFAGVLVDRLNRRQLLIISDSLRAVIVLMFLLVTTADRLWLIYVLTILQFCLSALFEPARSAIVPSLVPSDDLVKANLLSSVTWSVMLAAGAALGGLVASVFGTPTALCVDAASFALSALLISSIRLPQTKPTLTINSSSVIKDSQQLGFIDGLRYLAKHPATAATLLIKMGGSFGSIDVLMTIYATQLFVLGDGGKGSLGVLYTAFGLGALVGPALLNRFNNGSVHKMRRLVVAGYACIAVGWFLFGGATTLALAGIAIIVKAMGSSVYWTYSSVIIQKVVPDKFLGRLFSLDLAGFQLSTVISISITSWLIDQVNIAARHNSLYSLSITSWLSNPSAVGVRNIVIGSGFVSLVPLILWMLALPWIERQDKTQPV